MKQTQIAGFGSRWTVLAAVLLLYAVMHSGCGWMMIRTAERQSIEGHSGRPIISKGIRCTLETVYKDSQTDSETVNAEYKEIVDEVLCDMDIINDIGARDWLTVKVTNLGIPAHFDAPTAMPALLTMGVLPGWSSEPIREVKFELHIWNHRPIYGHYVIQETCIMHIYLLLTFAYGPMSGIWEPTGAFENCVEDFFEEIQLQPEPQESTAYRKGNREWKGGKVKGLN